jgi:hypothetical protein
MPESGPAHNEVEANISNCTLTGDFVNAQAGDHEMVLTFKNTTLTGAITTGTVTHAEGEPSEDKWWLIGTVESTYEPVEKDLGTTASFDAASKWTVDKTSYLSGLTLAEGAVVTAPAGKTLTMTVDGKETAIVPGTYAGKIVLTVA